MDEYGGDILVMRGDDGYCKQKGGVEDMGGYGDCGDLVERVEKGRRKVGDLDQVVMFGGGWECDFE
ncbi:sporulation peptidase YabG [Bacillus altitudinis]|uniref:sporulation peptidase YabG n=1 Tax=Bacillus altitudinis TaxID=293387 RepID=UPI0011A7DBA9